MVFKISSHNIPHAFGHIMELSQLPTESTYDVIFNNKTIDQATERAVDDTDMLSDSMFPVSEENGDMFSDNIEQAIYQTENPNAVMTPWGPAMDPMDVDGMMADYFGADSLVGLDPNETQGLFDEADAIIDASGGQLDEIVKQADATAMAEDLSPNEVGVGIVDEMSNQPGPGIGFEADDADRGLSWWDRLMGLNIVEAAGLDDEDDSQVVPTRSITPVPATVPLAPGQTDEGWNNYILQEDLGFLYSLEDLSDEEVMSEISQALNDKRLLASSILSWVQNNPELSTETGIRYNLGQSVLSLALGPTAYEGNGSAVGTGVDNGTVPTDKGSAAEAAKAGGTMYEGSAETVNKELDRIYLETTGALPDKRADEAETLFWLYKHGEIGLQAGNIEKVGSLYRPFLADYINNRYKYTSGSDFDASIRRLSEELTKGPDGTGYSTYMQGYFGGDDEDDIKRRNILIKLYNTGSSYGPSEMHSGIEQGIEVAKLRGKKPAEIFEMYTLPKYTPQIPDTSLTTDRKQYDHGIVYEEDQDRVDSDTMASGVGTTTPYQYDVSGLRDPALSFTPELYSPGTQRFGIPGETMAMRYRRFREDPYQPLSPVYDRTGMQDSALSMTPELMGGGGNRFGNTDWVPDMAVQPGVTRFPFESNQQQSIPGINAAALPLDLEEDVPYYTDSSKGSEFYKQAMEDPVMGAAMRARMGLDDIPMIGMPEQLEAEHLASMPEPFDEVERAKRDKGLRYQTGRWTGGSQYQWDTMDPEEKKRIMGTDAWVGGTSFVPTIGWRP